MTSVNCSRVLKVIHLARLWPSQRHYSYLSAVHRQPLLRLSCHHRCASLQSQTSKSSSKGREDEEDEDAPIPYLNSKARDWSVLNSYGRHKKRPLYKVVPLSIGLTVFMAWIFLRNETELDRRLEVNLHEHSPNLFKDPSTKGVEKDPVLAGTKEEEKPKE